MSTKETATPQQRQAEVMLTTLDAVEELFDTHDSVVTVTITPEDDEGNELEPYTKDVHFKACKLKHLGPLTVLMQSFLESLGDEQTVKVLEYVSEHQQKNLEEGSSPYALDTQALVREATSGVSVIGQLFAGAAKTLPQFVSLFTNLSKEELDDMDVPSVILVAYGIFARNFSFFIQNGRLLYQALMVSVARRLEKIPKKATATQ